MSRLEEVVEELKSLPANKLEKAADFIHRLRIAGSQEDRSLLGQTAGRLTAEEAAELEKIIEAGCEWVDERECIKAESRRSWRGPERPFPKTT